VQTLGKAGEVFPSTTALPSANTALGKVTISLPSVSTRQKLFLKKKYFAECLSERHSANIIFLKKIKNSLPSACHVSTRQRNRQMTVDVNFAEC